MVYCKVEIILDNAKKHDALSDIRSDPAIIAYSLRTQNGVDYVSLQVNTSQADDKFILEKLKALGDVVEVSKNETVHFEMPQDQFALSELANNAEWEKNLPEYEKEIDRLLDDHVFAPESKPDNIAEKIALLDELDSKRWHHVKYLRAEGFSETDSEILAVGELPESEVLRKVREYEASLVDRN